MPDYIPSPSDWVRDQVELYERTNGAEGNTLRENLGLPIPASRYVADRKERAS